MQESKYFLFNNMPHLFLRDIGEDNTKIMLQNDEDVLLFDSALHFMFSPTGIRCHMKTKKKVKTI